MINLNTNPESHLISVLNIDDIANIVIPFVDSAPVDGIFGNKKELFLFGTEGATDYCVVK